jgi:REP element-mobilizing transposase RayT
MSRKFKFKDNDKLYFVSFATVKWIDVFVRPEYKEIVLDSIRYCQREKGLEIYAWCIMTSHVHLIIGSIDKPMESIMRDLKSFTSRKMRVAIQNHPRESRKEWLLWLFEQAGQKNSNNEDWQFWQQDNHPIELYNVEIMQQKLHYIHQNPVEAGFVDEAKAWIYSSARDYAGEKGLLDIIFME